MKIEGLHGSVASLASTIALHVGFEICFTMFDPAYNYSLKHDFPYSFIEN